MRKKHKIGTILQIIGIVLMLSAAGLAVYNHFDEKRAGESAQVVLQQMEIGTPLTSEAVGETVIPDYVLAPEMPMPTKTISNYPYLGKIEIESLQLSLPVIADWSMDALREAPCCYAGSVYTDNMIIAGHNYKTHFGPLKNIALGSPVVFTDLDGNVFQYTAVDIEVLEDTAIEAMVSGDWDLTLFTCTVGGQARVAVRCEKAQ